MNPAEPQVAAPRRYFSPVRLLSVVASVTAVYFISRRLDREQLYATLRHAEFIWFGFAAMAFVVALSLGAWRWHQMLRLTGIAVSLGTSWRLSVVGHCFSTFFFGAAVSDLAKASLYSRGYGFPMTRVLAASALDRTTGVMSTLIYGLLTALLAWWSAPHFAWDAITFPSPGKLVLGGLAGVVVVAIALFATRSLWLKGWNRLAGEIRRAFRELWLRPGLTIAAIAAGLAIQVLVSAVLGCCLRAVHPAPLPWTSLLWTFPVIGVAASLPITISGAGARDGAAILLWGAFGVAGTEAFSASLLTLSVNLIWAVMGILVLFLSRRQWTGSAEPLSKGLGGGNHNS